LNYDRIEATIDPAERWSGTGMDCPICRDLKRTYEVGLSEYIEARSSACFQVSKRLAARKNVDMERARYELEEHRFVCVSAISVLALLPERDVSTSLKQLAA
jgi:predicted PolB exonuclease-like 3'-5' exonuclease